MRKITKTFSAVLLALTIILSSAAGVSAKDLEPCYHCGSTGRFECPNCHNQVQITCDGCNGAGGSRCDGEEGKGPCDNGYYICPSCHGDGYARSGDGTIAPDTPPNSCGYGTCNGTGRIECWKCHGKAWLTCDRCNGTGKEECQNANCIESRKVDWKCHYCMGTGYMLTNFWPGENDGVQNKPVTGDKIWVNGKSADYSGGGSGQQGGWNDQSGGNSGGSDSQNQGGNSSGSGNQNQGGNGSGSGTENPRYDQNGANIPRDPRNGRDFVWYVDLGSGTWEVDGRVITAKRGGKTVSGVLDVHYNDNILLDGFISSGAFAYLVASDGSKIQLSQSGDGEVAVGRHIPEDAYVPFKVSLIVERPSDNPAPGGQDGQNDPESVTCRVDFGGGSWNVDGKEVTATVDGRPAAGIMELTDRDSIKIHGLDRDTMQVRVYGYDGFSVGLALSGDDEASLGRLDREDTVLPPEIRFVIEKRSEGPEGPDGPGEPGQHADVDLLEVDFGKGSWSIEGAGKPVVPWVDGHSASGTEKLKDGTVVFLEDFDAKTMQVRVYADDGFSCILDPNAKNEVELRHEIGPDTVLPPSVHFVVEAKGASGQPETPASGSGSGFPVVPVAIGAVVVIAAVCALVLKKKKSS